MCFVASFYIICGFKFFCDCCVSLLYCYRTRFTWLSTCPILFICCFLSLIEQVALKTLIVIHRLLREGDITFREELLTFSQRGRVLQLSNFKDDSGPIGCSLVFSLFFSGVFLYLACLLCNFLML